MIILTILLSLFTMVLLLPLISDLTNLTLIRRSGRADEKMKVKGALPRLLFLVPAHNEELLLSRTLTSLDQLDYPTDLYDVVVIADNCTDSTAEVAEGSGVTCLERTDPTNRGKPFAIAWALERLDISEYAGVVIADADSLLDRGFAHGLAGHSPLEEKALQCYNDVENRTDSALTMMGATFSAVRCLLMNGIKERTGLNVPMGNGLCIGTAVLSKYGWNAFSICEDWELYAQLTLLGVPIENAVSARIASQEAQSLRQSSSQRRRWTAGKLMVLRSYGLNSLKNSLIGGRQKLDLLAELTAPGPAVHLGLILIALSIIYLADPPGADWIVFALLLSITRIIIYSGVAIAVGPEPIRSMLAFLYLPIYTVWRLSLQIFALPSLSGTEWVRTTRHHANPPHRAGG